MSNDKRVGNGSLSRQDEKRKALVTYLCRALKLAKDLGVMDEDWTCDRLIDTPSIFSGITVVPSTSGLDPTQPRGYFTDNTQVQLTPDTTGHSSGIGKSLSPRHEVPDDVIEITDEEDRPPSEFIISPKQTPRRLTPIPQRQRPQEQSFQESSRQPSSPRYPLHRTKSKKVRMYRDIVQAFEDLVQNISQHSRVLNETRLSGNDRYVALTLLYSNFSNFIFIFLELIGIKLKVKLTLKTITKTTLHISNRTQCPLHLLLLFNTKPMPQDLISNLYVSIQHLQEHNNHLIHHLSSTIELINSFLT